MAVAVVETGDGGDSSAGTTATISLPSTLSGRLVIVLATNGPPSSVTWPGGWTVLIDDTDGDGSTSGLYAAERELTGTEGTSIDVSLGSSQNWSYVWTRYTGNASAGAEAGTVATGDSATPDAPSLTPSGGSDEYMWIAAMGMDNGTTEITGYPTNYSLGQIKHDWADEGFSSAPGAGMASRLLTAASENPGTFAIDAADQWLANTFALAPPSAFTALPGFHGANRGIMRGAARGVG